MARRRRRKARTAEQDAKTIQVLGFAVHFKPGDGLFFFIAGIPIFFGLRVFGQLIAGDLENIGRYFWWALIMAASAGLLATFTTLFDRD